MITERDVDVFDVWAGANRYDVINKLIDHARATGREAWAEFNEVMLKAKPDSTWPQVDADWYRRRA